MSEFIDYLKELFSELGPVQARKMFGGYGIYLDGVMFGLIDDDTLYLKTDETTVQDFEARGLMPFEYNKGGKIIKMSYYLAPDEVLEDPDDAIVWGKRAYEVALRAKQSNK